MDILSKLHLPGATKMDWKFLVKLCASGVLTAIGIFEAGMNHEFAFAALLFVPLGGLFFTFLKLEADRNIVRIISIIIVALIFGLWIKSIFLGLAFFLILEGATHKDCLTRYDDTKWMKVVRTGDSLKDMHDVVYGHTLFQGLPKKDKESLVAKCRVIELEPGAALIKQGEFNYYLYLIAKGSVDVISDGELVASLKDGDVVGEISTIGLSMPVADVVANTDVVAFSFPVDEVNAAAKDHLKFAEQMQEIGMRRMNKT